MQVAWPLQKPLSQSQLTSPGGQAGPPVVVVPSVVSVPLVSTVVVPAVVSVLPVLVELSVAVAGPVLVEVSVDGPVLELELVVGSLVVVGVSSVVVGGVVGLLVVD